MSSFRHPDLKQAVVMETSDTCHVQLIEFFFFLNFLNLSAESAENTLGFNILKNKKYDVYLEYSICAPLLPASE